MITGRELNRAMLARQLLLERTELPAAVALERLLGLNAQGPNIPYLALWSRLPQFGHAHLDAALAEDSVVRSTMMRATQHLVTAADFAWLRPLLAPLLQRVHRNAWGSRSAGIDLQALTMDARALLSGRTLTRSELGRRLAETRPGASHTALGWTAQYLLPVVHPVPSGTWNAYGQTPFALAEDRVGPLATGGVDDLQHLVRRYLAAFGPATTSDIRAFSGIAGLREVVHGMRSELRVDRTEAGRDLFDLPDAPRPPADTPAPVRFLPEFDAPMLAYHDRTRIMTDDIRRQVCVGDATYPTVLVDGTVAALWSLDMGSSEAAVLTINLLRPITAADCDSVEGEGAALLVFAAPDRSHDLRWQPGIY